LSNLKRLLHSKKWQGNFNNFQKRWESYMKHLK
jgi:hypothetical protein